MGFFRQLSSRPVCRLSGGWSASGSSPLAKHSKQAPQNDWKIGAPFPAPIPTGTAVQHTPEKRALLDINDWRPEFSGQLTKVWQQFVPSLFHARQVVDLTPQTVLLVRDLGQPFVV